MSACLLAMQTEFVDDYGDYDGRVQECDDDDNPIDSDLEESLDTEQVSIQLDGHSMAVTSWRPVRKLQDSNVQ